MEKKSEECLKTSWEPFHFHSIKLQASPSQDSWYCEVSYQAKLNFMTHANESKITSKRLGMIES